MTIVGRSEWGRMFPSGSQSGNDVIGQGYAIVVEVFARIIDVNPFFGCGFLGMVAVVADDHMEWVSHEMNDFDMARIRFAIIVAGSPSTYRSHSSFGSSCSSSSSSSSSFIFPFSSSSSSSFSCFSFSSSPSLQSGNPPLPPHPSARQNLPPHQRSGQDPILAKQIGTLLHVHRPGPNAQPARAGRATVVLSGGKGRSGPVADLIEGESSGGGVGCFFVVVVVVGEE